MIHTPYVTVVAGSRFRTFACQVVALTGPSLMMDGAICKVGVLKAGLRSVTPPPRSTPDGHVAVSESLVDGGIENCLSFWT
jgi:hypothetical protein